MFRFYANVRLPHYGWFGDEFASEAEARSYVARMLWSARADRLAGKPRYSSRAYIIKPVFRSGIDNGAPL